jgi:hypothetical protein
MRAGADMVVDVHTHFIPEELIAMIAGGEGPTGLTW